MKTKMILVALLLTSITANTQDLDLEVRVLPTSVLGDPAMFNITVRNTDEEPAQGVEVQLSMKSGLKLSSFTPKNADFNPETGIWRIGVIEKRKLAFLGIIANYIAKEDAILIAEISKSAGIDPDSTPGNGVDTNGNGKIVHDKEDEDDGDAAQNGPYKLIKD